MVCRVKTLTATTNQRTYFRHHDSIRGIQGAITAHPGAAGVDAPINAVPQ